MVKRRIIRSCAVGAWMLVFYIVFFRYPIDMRTYELPMRGQPYYIKLYIDHNTSQIKMYVSKENDFSDLENMDCITMLYNGDKNVICLGIDPLSDTIYLPLEKYFERNIRDEKTRKSRSYFDQVMFDMATDPASPGYWNTTDIGATICSIKQNHFIFKKIQLCDSFDVASYPQLRKIYDENRYFLSKKLIYVKLSTWYGTYDLMYDFDEFDDFHEVTALKNDCHLIDMDWKFSIVDIK